jgi:hypothetical protein
MCYALFARDTRMHSLDCLAILAARCLGGHPHSFCCPPTLTHAQGLLGELEASNMLHGESTWTALRHMVMQDVRFVQMLGQPGECVCACM